MTRLTLPVFTDRARLVEKISLLRHSDSILKHDWFLLSLFEIRARKGDRLFPEQMDKLEAIARRQGVTL